MRKKHLKHLVCPDCREGFTLEIKEQKDGLIKDGALKCSRCCKEYPITNYIPRFVPEKNYGESYSLQWKKHSKTLHDNSTGCKDAEKCFFEETKWGNLKGEIILEAGSGTGRLTEQVLKTNATVISFDISNSVEQNYENNRNKDNLLIIQADIARLPFKYNFFDRIFCLCMLQHTKNPEISFMNIINHIKFGGEVVIDIYAKRYSIKGLLNKIFLTKYLVRPITRKMDCNKLYNLCERYVDIVLPITKKLNKIPFGRHLVKALLIADYRHRFNNLPLEKLKEIATCETYDMLSPMYDNPQRKGTILKWFKKAGLSDIEIGDGNVGIRGRGIKLKR